MQMMAKPLKDQMTLTNISKTQPDNFSEIFRLTSNLVDGRQNAVRESVQDECNKGVPEID